nr:10009_t:CDS:2 [Entrophospora candida]
MERKVKDLIRNYSNILLEARGQLQDILGMDLVELPIKEKKAVRGGANSKANKEKSTSKSYMLVNTLAEKYDEDLSEVINWDKNNQLEHMGVLYVVLSVIYVNDQLTHYFRRLHLYDDGHVESDDNVDIDALLPTFIKQGYLEKNKTGIRDQSSTDNPDREHVEYRWGPRAKIEFPEDKMIEFIKNVYGDNVPNDIEKRIERYFVLISQAKGMIIVRNFNLSIASYKGPGRFIEGQKYK